MNCKIYILICLWFAVNIESRKYRYDYKYYPQIEGWLKLNKIPTTWNKARLRCTMEGGELASPLNDAFIKTLKDKSEVSTWSGVHSTFSKGDYFSIGGIPLLKMPISWAPGEPDNYGNKEECIAMMPNGSFADVCCDELFPYFCFKKKTGAIVFETCGSANLGYVYEKRTGSCYKFHNHVLTWNDAFMTCAAEGGYLAVINTAVETVVLNDILSKYPKGNIHGATRYKDTAFIGIHDWGEHGVWATIHGEPVERLIDIEAVYWCGGEPNNNTMDGKGQSCGSIGRNGHINDSFCHIPHAFICEKAPDSLQEIDSDY